MIEIESEIKKINEYNSTLVGEKSRYELDKGDIKRRNQEKKKNLMNYWINLKLKMFKQQRLFQ